MAYTKNPAQKVKCTCLYCKSDFWVESWRIKRGDVKYCSKTCANAGSIKRQACSCKQCGKEFEEEPAQIARGQGKYCSNECAHMARIKLLPIGCPECGKTFKPKGSNTKYCCKACSNAALGNKTECVCKECGVIFFVKPSHVAKGVGKYCSRECYTKAGNVNCICEVCNKPFQIKRNRIRNGGGRFCSYECSVSGKLKPVFRNCDYCGKEYRTTAGKINRGFNSYYCSYECSCLGRRKRVEISCDHCGIMFWVHQYKVNQRGRKYCSKACEIANRNIDIDCQCAHCGKPLRLPPSRLKTKTGKVFCSKKCAHSSHRGKNHHFWLGGHSSYRGENWYEQRKLAYERDGGKCQVCHSFPKNGERKNSVHHIRKYRDFNGDYVAANDLLNLVTLCEVCHGKAEHGKIPVPKRLL